MRSIAMSLSFPNASRSFNPDRQSIQFWASDRTLEISFELDHSALTLMNAEAKSEAEYLMTFDSHRALIEAAALKAYQLDAGSFHMLDKSSF